MEYNSFYGGEWWECLLCGFNGVCSGKISFDFSVDRNVSGESAYYRFSARLSQQLLIPGNYQQLEFTLNSKCLNVNRGWLKVVALNEKEECLYQDSVQIHKKDEWNRCVLKLPAQGACLFRIEIYAVGEDDWLKASLFSVDRIQILGDGKNIDWSESLPVFP